MFGEPFGKGDFPQQVDASEKALSIGGITMSVEENKAIARRVFEEVWNQGNLAVVDEIIATIRINSTLVNRIVAYGFYLGFWNQVHRIPT